MADSPAFATGVSPRGSHPAPTFARWPVSSPAHAPPWTPLSISDITLRHYRPTLTRAGVTKHLRLYDLRHSFATLSLLAGVHAKVVSEALGHASVAFTMDTYAHVLPSMQESAAEKIAELLFG